MSVSDDAQDEGPTDAATAAAAPERRLQIEHPSTAGWDGPEPEGTNLDDDDDGTPPRTGAEALPTSDMWVSDDAVPPGEDEAMDDPAPGESAPVADDWPADDDEAEGWDDLSARVQAQRTGASSPWSDLEEESRALPAGLTRIGRVENVRLMGAPIDPIRARMETGVSRSRLHADVQTALGDTVSLRLDGTVVRFPRATSDGEGLGITVTLHMAGIDLPVTLRVAPPTDSQPLVLGCDVLAGHFVVDPGAEFVVEEG